MLGKGAIKAVHAAVDKLFDHIKLRFLGPKLVDKTLAIGYRKDLTLPGLYESAVREEGAAPDPTTMNSLLSVAEGYIEAQRSRAKAQVVQGVNAFLEDAEAAGEVPDVKTVLGGQLSETFEDITNDVKRIVDSEAQNGRALGTLEGIVQINAKHGIEDPVVYFVIVRDNNVCDECKRLHLMPDEVTPRCWYFSEVGNGYHKRGDANPKHCGLHPHCRCTEATLMPGWGFDKAGSTTYVGPDHDEIAQQRGMTKSEDLDTLIARLHKHRSEGCALPEKLAKAEPIRDSRTANDLDAFIFSLKG